MKSAAAAALLLIAASTLLAQEKSHPTSASAAKMRQAAERLFASVPQATLQKMIKPLEDADRLDWHYTPRSRNGAALKDLDARGREAVHALLRQALSAVGYRKLTNILELELVLREIETFGLMRDPERYHITFYGAPNSAKPWGWRFEGHHLSLNFTLAGDRMAVDTPSFFGANPARVARGKHQGLRVLGPEEDEARVLLGMLDEAQRREAVFDSRTFGEIVTRNAEKVDPMSDALRPVGVPAAKLNQIQQLQLMKLIETYANNFEPGLAAARMARVREGGVENIRFGWAGATERGKPHYYRVQGPLFLIEYDCSQNDGNHIHTVWRDFNGDFGRDLLRQHYQAARGTAHKH